MGVLRTWKPDLAVIQMVRCGWAADVIRGLEPGLPVVFDAIDCMAMHYRRAAARGPWPLRLANGFESARCRRRETELVRTATVTTAVSDRDLESLGAGTSGMVVTVTGGLELSGERSDPPQPTVLLSGNLGYRPTVRAACWFADRVWPGIRGAVPGAIWVLAGARPPAAILRLAARPGVEVHGDVDDLAPYLERATVAVAPMAGGSGVPVKILEAMAARVPVVADPWSCSGLADPAAVIGANEPSEWIEVLTRVLTNPEVARRQAASGYEVWRSFYRPERVADQIRAAVASALGP
jgi:hypothetical protein